MTLYKFLVEKEIDCLSKAICSFKDTNKYHQLIGASNACRDLLDTLSDETLRMEVKTRSEVIVKGESK